MLAQRKELKRLEKDFEKGLREAEDDQREKGEEEKARAVVDFEKTMMGLEDRGRNSKQNDDRGATDTREGSGVKRKRELDEDQMLKNALEERAKARRAIDEEKVRLPVPLTSSRLTWMLTGRRGQATLLLGPLPHPFNQERPLNLCSTKIEPPLPSLLASKQAPTLSEIAHHHQLQIPKTNSHAF